MNDAVKMALEALTDIRTSIECATGCDEGIDPMAAVSEIMSAYGTAMASAYSRAADMLNILAALEQAGEPVACVACDDTPSAENNPCAVCGKRLGQEFDAGEPDAWRHRLRSRDENGTGIGEWSEWRAGKAGNFTTRYIEAEDCPLYAHPPQSRGQAFDGELPLKFDPRDAKLWWEENMKESKFVSARLAGDGYVKFQWRDADESGDYSVPWTRIALWLAALSSAKRGEQG